MNTQKRWIITDSQSLIEEASVEEEPDTTSEDLDSGFHMSSQSGKIPLIFHKAQDGKHDDCLLQIAMYPPYELLVAGIMNDLE